MMFLIRTAFWLMIVVLLVPTNKEHQNQIYGTAQAAFNDVARFCDRNPQTCATSQEVFAVFVQKAQYGAQMVMTMVEEHTASTGNGVPGPLAMPGGGSVMPVPAAAPLEPATWDESNSQDTLSPEDREAAWGGPDV